MVQKIWLKFKCLVLIVFNIKGKPMD